MIEPKNPTNNADEYAHLPWEDHPDNPDNYPEMVDRPKEKPTDSYEVSYEYAESIGAEYTTLDELEELGLDTDTKD